MKHQFISPHFSYIAVPVYQAFGIDATSSGHLLVTTGNDSKLLNDLMSRLEISELSNTFNLLYSLSYGT